jgi:hypothetical protein
MFTLIHTCTTMTIRKNLQFKHFSTVLYSTYIPEVHIMVNCITAQRQHTIRRADGMNPGTGGTVVPYHTIETHTCVH